MAPRAGRRGHARSYPARAWEVVLPWNERGW